MKSLKVCIAGLGNVGSSLVEILDQNNQKFIDKKLINIDIKGITAKNKDKKRDFNIESHKWFDDPKSLILNSKADIFIELIGEEKGISYDLIKIALQNNLHVITANKALLANYGNELFHLAEKNNLFLLFEASVAGGIPIIKLLKQSLFLNNIKKISGILNGTTNFILSEMEKNDSDIANILNNAKKNGFAEADSTNDLEGIDSAHKLAILSTICFGLKFNFKNVLCKGITEIKNEDIKSANKLGYKIKLIGSSEIKYNKIKSIVEPVLIKSSSKLANVDGVLNGINIETNFLNSLFIEGEGAGGKATVSSIISDIMEIANSSNINSLGFKTSQLKDFESINYNEISASYYLRIQVKDIPGVLAKITTIFNDNGISIETILQIPEVSTIGNIGEVPIIITTHQNTLSLLNKAIMNIENLDFVVSKIVIIRIDN